MRYEKPRLLSVTAAHVAEVEAENAKLRELAKDMLSELRAATQYDAGGGQGVVHEFADRMRELGVEVDG